MDQVLDATKVQIGAPLPRTDVLWIAEQVPGELTHDFTGGLAEIARTHCRSKYVSNASVGSGLVATMDVTSVLVTKGFWPSYNIAYIPEIYQWSGYPANRSSSSGYDGAPRARYAATSAI